VRGPLWRVVCGQACTTSTAQERVFPWSSDGKCRTLVVWSQLAAVYCGVGWLLQGAGVARRRGSRMRAPQGTAAQTLFLGGPQSLALKGRFAFGYAKTHSGPGRCARWFAENITRPWARGSSGRGGIGTVRPPECWRSSSGKRQNGAIGAITRYAVHESKRSKSWQQDGARRQPFR